MISLQKQFEVVLCGFIIKDFSDIIIKDPINRNIRDNIV